MYLLVVVDVKLNSFVLDFHGDAEVFDAHLHWQMPSPHHCRPSPSFVPKTDAETALSSNRWRPKYALMHHPHRQTNTVEWWFDWQRLRLAAHDPLCGPEGGEGIGDVVVCGVPGLHLIACGFEGQWAEVAGDEGAADGVSFRCSLGR